MCVVTMIGLISISKMASLTPFPLKILLTGLHQSYRTMHDSTVSTALPAAGLT